MATICTATTRGLPRKGNDLRVRARRIWGEVPGTGSSGARRLGLTVPSDGIGWSGPGEAEGVALKTSHGCGSARACGVSQV